MLKTFGYRLGCTLTVIGLVLVFSGSSIAWLIGIPALALVIYNYDH